MGSFKSDPQLEKDTSPETSTLINLGILEQIKIRQNDPTEDFYQVWKNL